MENAEPFEIARKLFRDMHGQCPRHLKPSVNLSDGRCADCYAGIPGQGDGFVTNPDGSKYFSHEKAVEVARERANWP